MAILKHFKEIEDFIPEPYYRLYGNKVTEADKRNIANKQLFAITVNRNLMSVINTFKANFLLIRRNEKFYLMVASSDKETYSDYVFIDDIENKTISKLDWPFKTDEIGLRLDSFCYDKNIIYFGNDKNDAKEIMKQLKIKKENRILTLKPVIV